MLNISFSAYGTAALVLILIFSLFVQYVFSYNLRGKYENIKTSINSNSIKFAFINADRKIKFFNGGRIFWNMDNSYGMKVVVPEWCNASNSIYCIVNATFKSELSLSASARDRIFGSFWYRFWLIILALNVVWSLIFGFWIMVAIAGGLFVGLSLIEWMITRKLIKKSLHKTITLIIDNAAKDEEIAVRKYSKYKKVEFLWKYLACFIAAWVELFMIIKALGNEQ